MAAPPAAVRTLATHTVGGPACCAAAADAQVSTAFVVGTYALDEAAGVRRGQLHLFQGAAVAKDGELRVCGSPFPGASSSQLAPDAPRLIGG
jgi:hypothetical protein